MNKTIVIDLPLSDKDQRRLLNLFTTTTYDHEIDRFDHMKINMVVKVRPKKHIPLFKTFYDVYDIIHKYNNPIASFIATIIIMRRFHKYTRGQP